MSLIPNNIIDEVRERSDIIAVISEHVLIKKTGQNYKGLCPFHPEKTPSFTVSPTKKIFHCFGCGAGGNVFNFLMRSEGITFVEAIKQLSFRYGVPIPEMKLSSDNENSGFRERSFFFNVNGEALEFFQEQLRDPLRGKRARKYLESRSFGEEIQKKFCLGFAPLAWRELSSYLQNKKGFSTFQLEKAGLVKRKEKKNNQGQDSVVWYDRFRGRIIFPLKDVQGNLVGFAGRLIAENDQEPKYLNSPETFIYKKSYQLFGFNTAKNHIHQENEVLIVEGYFDQIRLHQHGILNVVATCGTALTSQQVALLSNHTQNVVLIFDSDLAGQSATMRGIELLLERGMRVRVLTLPQKEDPDTFVLKKGRDGFKESLQKALPFLEYIIRSSKGRDLAETTTRRIEIINTILPFLIKIPNEVERRDGFDLLVYELNIQDRDLLAELKKSYEKNKPFLSPPESKANYHKNPEEYYLLLLILFGGKIAETIHKEIGLEMFRDKIYATIAKVFYEQLDQGEDIRVDRALDELKLAEGKELLAKLSVSSKRFDDPEKAADDCIRKIKMRTLEERIKTIKKERNEAVEAGETLRSRQLQEAVREMQISLNQVIHKAG